MSQKFVEADQVEINKHIKMHSGDFKFDVHCAKDGIGFWLSNRKDNPDENMIGAYIGNNQSPFIMIYPERDFWQGRKGKLPFALSPKGLQIPHADGTVTHLSLRDISDLVKLLPKSN